MRPRRGVEARPQEPRTRINEAIRVPRVRLIDSDGAQIGVRSREEAMDYAWGKNLDLVEVAPDANPPVCRVMDYSKYKYEQEQKQKLARKHQSTITIKEIKLRPKIDPHDYATKKGHVVRFLKNRDKVKVTIMFRGREMTHPERGRTLLLRLADDVKELGIIESEPLQDGRNMVMMLAPVKEKEQPVPGAKAPTDAAAEAPADVAVETPADAAVEAAADAPVETPADAPVEAAADAPAEAPADAPAEAPADAAVEAAADAQVETPADAPAEAPAAPAEEPAAEPARAAAAGKKS